eukprot:1008250-Rhodomonas_salina.1
MMSRCVQTLRLSNVQVYHGIGDDSDEQDVDTLDARNSDSTQAHADRHGGLRLSLSDSDTGA